MTDVRMYQTNDGGEIDVVNGNVAMDSGVETAAYLSMFGGNSDDSGLACDDERQFWGNLIERDNQAIYRSETQYLLRTLPAITANLKRIRDAVMRDLDWLTRVLNAKIEASVTMPALNRIRIDGSIQIDGKKYPIRFDSDWNGQNT